MTFEHQSLAYNGKVRAQLINLVRALTSRGQLEEYIDTGNLCHFKNRVKAVIDKIKEHSWVERPGFFSMTIPLK